MPSAAADPAHLLGELVAQGEASAAVGLVGDADRILWRFAAGEARPGAAAGPTTLFDYGSLTKPFVATLALVLAERGEMPLRAELGSVWRGGEGLAPSLRQARLSDLLRHRSGMQAWAPLYARCQGVVDVERFLVGGELVAESTNEVYSDLGYLLWGRAAERRTGRTLASLVREEVLEPLGAQAVEVEPGDRPDVALSRCGAEREIALAAEQGLDIASVGVPPPGQPLDGNARFLLAQGWGLPAQAGLFGTADDLWRLGAEWLRPDKLLNQEAVSAALRGGRRFACGWWRRRTAGAAGTALSSSSFGHTGFPGGNLWVDPERNRVFVLLAHRTSSRNDMNLWRRRFHAAASQPNHSISEEGSR